MVERFLRVHVLVSLFPAENDKTRERNKKVSVES